MKKSLKSIGIGIVATVLLVAPVTNANAGALGVGSGVYVGDKQLCKVHVSWPMSIWQGDYKWVLCKSIGK